MSTMNVSSLSRPELEEEFKLSQWALTWAITKLGGKLEITPEDMANFNVLGRIWYQQLPCETGGLVTVVEFREKEPQRILLPGRH